MVDRFAQVHARPSVQDADRLLLCLAQHGPPHGYGALFGHGLEHAGELLVDLGVVTEDQGESSKNR